MRLLLVVDDHRLDIRQHVLALPEASIFHLALLDALHTASLLSDQISAPSVLFVARAVHHSRHVAAVTRVYVGLDRLVVSAGVIRAAIFVDRGSLTRLLALLLLFLATIVASVALAVLGGREVPVISISRLELFNTLLQLAEVELEILVHLAHLKVLLFEVLSTLVRLCKLLVQVDFGDAQSSQLFFSSDILV